MNADMGKPKLATNRHVARFAKAARRYCTLIEKRSQMRPLEFLGAVNRALVEVHSAVLTLPNVGLRGDVQEKRMTTKEWLRLFRSLQRKLGKRDGYWKLFDGTKGESPTYHSLSDDLGDLYHDLSRGLELFDRGGEDEVRAAIWDWRFVFTFHWGRHLVDCVSAMYRVLSVEDDRYMFKARRD